MAERDTSGFGLLAALLFGLLTETVYGSPVAAATVSSQPHFVGFSKVVRVEMGETAQLPCNVQNLGNYMVLWKRDSTVLTASTLKIIRDDRIQIEGTSIEIGQVSAKDSGVYHCELNTDPPISLNVTLDVLEPPKIRRFPDDGRVQARKGDAVTLECLGEGNPTPIITWSRPSRLLPNGADMQQGPGLRFDSVTRSEVGRYMCTADNGVGKPVSAQVELHVLYPPDIEIERNWIHTGLNQESYLTCTVHAEPSPTVHWYRDERVIVPSDNRILESSGNKHTLILRYVEENDFGLYSCTAENVYGRSSQNIELSGRPSRAIFESEPMGLAVDAFNLTWKIDSYAPIEEYRLMYRKLQYNGSEEMNHVWKSIILPGSSSTSSGSSTKSFSYHQVGYDKAASNKHHKQWFLLEDLDTGSVYEATVTAENRYGMSELSEAFQFNTLGSDYVPNVKNLEAKEVAGFEMGPVSSPAIRCGSSSLTLLVTVLLYAFAASL